MHPPIDLFECKRDGDTLVVRPATNLGEFEAEQIEREFGPLFKLLEDPSLRKVVVDFHRCAYFGSSAVGALVRIANAVRAAGGEMVLRNLSKCGQQLLDAIPCADLWTIKGSVSID